MCDPFRMVENRNDSEMEDEPHPTQKDDDEEEETESPLVRLDFEKLFRMAEDPDMEEMLRGPIETAILNLETGKEVQKLTAIRSFADLLATEGEECLQKLLPAIQKALQVEKSNLDLHCEAAVVYKSILHNEQLTSRFSGIVDLLLESILHNIQQQKENSSSDSAKVVIRVTNTSSPYHLSAAAWLETVVDVADRVSLASVKLYIVPLVQQQADPVQRVQRRIIATKLLHKLADILPANEVRRDLAPCVQTLCRDANSNVRTAIAQRLIVVAQALKSTHDVVSCVLPCFVQLANDEDASVREVAMNQLNDCIPLLTKDAKKHTLFPMIKKATEDALEKKDDTIVVVAANFGKWCHSLQEVLDQLDKSWALNTYCKLVQIAEEKVEAGAVRNSRNLLRKFCAFNYPCMLLLFPKNVERLVPFLETFCNDHDDEVRMCIAASYHEILGLHENRAALVPPFIELLRGGSTEVVSKVSFNLHKILPVLYSCVKEKPGKTTAVQLDRILIGCNQIVRSTGAWRSHEVLLKSLSVLPNCVGQRQLMETFVPLLRKEVLTVRAIPCRIAAASSLLLLMRSLSNSSARADVVKFFNEQVATHECSYRRSLFIDVVEFVLKTFSKRFFLQNFLDKILVLTSDKISNIRIRALRVLSKIKSRLQLPADDAILLRIEAAVREVLKVETNTATRQLLNSAAVELSRSETCERQDREDIEKMEEEDRLWSEERERAEADVIEQTTKVAKAARRRQSEEEEEGDVVRPSGIRPPGSYRSSLWRTERRAVAIVRPQPVVTMRSASPNPLSYRSPSPAPQDSRPSRLPLSAAAKEREQLRRLASDTPPNSRGTSRSSSVTSTTRNGIMSTSTSSLESSNNHEPLSSYGLRRSATSTSAFGGNSYTSSSSYALTSSRSTSNLRRPTYGLSHVSSHSTFERKPSHVSLRIRNVPTTLK